MNDSMLGTQVKLLGRALGSRIAPLVSHAILHVTNLCNMRCQHCFVNFEAKPNDLTLDEFCEISTVINDLIWLDVGGGEPFLRKDIGEIISLFRSEETSIPTNGWFPDRVRVGVEDSLRHAWKRLVVTVSLDGFREVHDEIRQDGSFDRAIATIRMLREFKGLRVKINTVVCERNVTNMIDFMKWVRDELSVDYQGLLLLRGDPINPLYRLPDTATLRALGQAARPIQHSYGYGRKGSVTQAIQRNYQALKWDLQMDTLERKTQVVPCLAGRVHLVIYANGDVAPCEILKPVGNLRERSLRDILEGGAWSDAVNSIKRKECHCTHDCNMLENILFNPMLYPSLLSSPA